MLELWCCFFFLFYSSHESGTIVKGGSLSTQFSQRSEGKELKILIQPETQHRARYLTEGSRGSVKDRTQQGFPTVKVRVITEGENIGVLYHNERLRLSFPAVGGHKWAGGAPGFRSERCGPSEASWFLPGLQSDGTQHHCLQGGGHRRHHCYWDPSGTQQWHDSGVRESIALTVGF